MLSKINRIDKKTMDALFKSGSFVNSTNLTLRFFVNKNRGVKPAKPKIAFITPKTLGLKSPGRNTLRRRGYAIVRNYIDQLPDGLVGAFIFKPRSKDFFAGRKTKVYNPSENLEKEIKELLKNMKKYEKTSR